MQHELLYCLIISLLIAGVFIAEAEHRKRYRSIVSSLKETDGFISMIRHYYFRYGSVRCAMEEAMAVLEGSIRKQGAVLLRLITAERNERDRLKHLTDGYNKYLRLFLSLSLTVDENGDEYNEEGSVYADALLRVRMEIADELRAIKEREHKYIGLTLTATLPLMAVPLISEWCSDTIPSLRLFYYSRAGALFRSAILAIAIVSYRIVFLMRGIEGESKRFTGRYQRFLNSPLCCRISQILQRLGAGRGKRVELYLRRINENHRKNSWYLERLILSLTVAILVLAVCAAGRMEAGTLLSEYVVDDGVSDAADSSFLSVAGILVPKYMKQMISLKETPSKEELVTILSAEKEVRSPVVAERIADELISRREQYLDNRLRLSDILIAISCGLMVYLGVYCDLWLRAVLAADRIHEETADFRMLIRMQYRVAGTDSLRLLESMEDFAVILKPALRRCIGEYSVSYSNAIRGLYESETDENFRSLITCFMTADEEGIAGAFDEIATDMTNDREMRAQDRRLRLEREGLVGSIISIMPGSVILIGYLMIPFAVRSIGIFARYRDELTTLIGG